MAQTSQSGIGMFQKILYLRLIPHFHLNEICPCRLWPELMRERRHLHGCLSRRDFLLRLAPRRLGAILCAKAAEAVFASRAGSSLRDARLSQALFLPPPSRPHAECVTRRRRVGAGESRPCISPAPRSGNPAGEMTDAPTPTRRKSSIIVGRNATSNEKQGDKPTISVHWTKASFRRRSWPGQGAMPLRGAGRSCLCRRRSPPRRGYQFASASGCRCYSGGARTPASACSGSPLREEKNFSQK